MQPDLIRELLEKYARGACTPAEEQFIHDWYDRIDDTEMQELAPSDIEATRSRIWGAIDPSPATRGSWLWKAAVITIPLLIGLGLYLNWHPLDNFVVSDPIQVVALSGEEQHIVNSKDVSINIPLADGSAVTLQAASEIFISPQFGEKDRTVRLKGEAFFDVRPHPEKPFFVYANEVVTRVLGTSFNVRAFDDDCKVTVAVRTGKVSVYMIKDDTLADDAPTAHEEVILTPNQQMVYHREKEELSRKLVKEPQIILPNSNLFRMQFENTEVVEIFGILEENYGIEIRYDRAALSGCKLTTSMSDEGLYERIEVICKAIGASYKIRDAVIFIESDGC